jgi:hypothetical protein
MIKGEAAPAKDPAATDPAAMAPSADQPQVHSGHATDSPVAAPQLYTCPMEEHADVVTDKPGKCPKCGMKLVPTSESEHGKQAEEAWHKQHAGVSQMPVSSGEQRGAAVMGLPAGHPPVSGAALTEYLRRVAAAESPSAAPANGACGSCGMSAAAMAAGEPCEHDATKAAPNSLPTSPSHGG